MLFRSRPSYFYTIDEACEENILAQKGELTWGEYTSSVREWWARLEAARLLVVDELGTRSQVSDHHYATLKRIIDCRHAKPLVLISNLSLQDLHHRYDHRITDRLAAGTVIRFPDVTRADRRQATTTTTKSAAASGEGCLREPETRDSGA